MMTLESHCSSIPVIFLPTPVKGEPWAPFASLSYVHIYFLPLTLTVEEISLLWIVLPIMRSLLNAEFINQENLINISWWTNRWWKRQGLHPRDYSMEDNTKVMSASEFFFSCSKTASVCSTTDFQGRAHRKQNKAARHPQTALPAVDLIWKHSCALPVAFHHSLPAEM